MKQTAYFGEKPDAVTVCVLPTGASDVWLRRNITQKQIADTGDGGVVTQWECEEVYARHGEKLTPESVQERFDEYWAMGENWPEATPDQPSDHERLVALEAGLICSWAEVATMYKFIKMQYQLHAITEAQSLADGRRVPDYRGPGKKNYREATPGAGNQTGGCTMQQFLIDVDKPPDCW